MIRDNDLVIKAKNQVKVVREFCGHTNDLSFDLWYYYMEKDIIEGPYKTKQLISFLLRSFWVILLTIFFFGIVWAGLYGILLQNKKPNSKILYIGSIILDKPINLTKLAQDNLAAYYVYKNKEIRILALAAYWEGRFEPTIGQEAIMHVIMNRMFNSKFPNTIAGVVYQGNGKYYQFSFLNPKGKHAGAFGRYVRLPDNKQARLILKVAKNIYEGKIKRPVYLKRVMRYMNPKFVSPKMKQIWRKTHKPVIQIASHTFWRKK